MNLNVKYKTMTAIATEILKESILSGIYPPGTKIIPAQLEKDLSLGVSPIRDAVRELSAIGLLINKPNKGTVVAEPVSQEEIVEIFDIRYMLEGQAAFNATKNIDTESILKLEEINHAISKIDPPSSRDFYDLNKEFHKILYQHSNRPFLLRLIEQIWDQIMLFRLLYPFGPEVINVCVEDHNQMITAIKLKKPNMVKKTLVAHLRRGFDNLMEQQITKRNL